MSSSSGPFLQLDYINLETIMDIQEDIDPCDTISLMFLLHEDPQKTLKSLLVYIQLVSDVGVTTTNLLHEWAAQAHTRKSWRWELLEALVTCQLYTIISKLGYHKQTVIKLFQKDNEISNYINPIRKLFYRVCENMDSASYRCFKKIINSLNPYIGDHNTCELVFLELMCRNYFSLGTDTESFRDNVKKLLQILGNIPSCGILCSELKLYVSDDAIVSEVHTYHTQVPSTSMASLEDNQDRNYVEDFTNEFDQFNELTMENLHLEDLKTDHTNSASDYGLCYIINQETFHSQNRSLEPLGNRPESAADKILLEKTMKDHCIEVTSKDNLSCKEMLNSISNVVNNDIKEHHRVFFLCILSHGSRDHVYSADSEKVSLYHIEDLLDRAHLRKIPKILIVQACQDDEPTLIADRAEGRVRKSNIVTFCATAPGLEAYRIKGVCSIFIGRLCKNIQEYSDKEHLTDLFTIITKDVEKFSYDKGVDQIPIILRNTLTTKVYLKKRTHV